jgi:radical SAM superfamily enzyme YgiQ (UPF0313 family)
LLYVGTVLRKYGCDIKLVDCSVEPRYNEILNEEVKDTDILGVYAMSVHIRHLLPLLSSLKKINQKMLIIWGGPHAILFPEQTAKHSLVDIACRGEGENVMLDIVRGLENGNLDLHKIDGISFSENGKVYINPYREHVDMNKVPFLDWTLVKKEIMEKVKRSIIRVQASRGCFYTCAFCINVLTNNRTMRYRDPKNILDEIESLKKKYNIKRVGFRDEVFMSDREQVRQIAQGLIDRNLKITWLGNPRCEYLRERYVDDDYLQLLKDSGCTKLQCGGESGSERILKLLRKGIKVRDILNFVRRTKKFGILPLVAFMTGIPTETKKEQKLTLLLIRDLVRIQPGAFINGPANFRPYPGGELYDMCIKKYNLKMPNSLDEWATAEMLGGRRPPWVKNLHLNTYLWSSIMAARFPKQMLIDPIRDNFFKGIGNFIFSKISKIRFRYIFYKFPIEFHLLALYHRFIAKTIPDFS